MILSMAMSVNAEKNSQVDTGTWINIPPYLYYDGVYYNTSSIDINSYWFNLETGEKMFTLIGAYSLVTLDDGKDYIQQNDFNSETGFKYTPIEEILPTLPILEYTISDLISVQKYIDGNFKINLEATPYYDYDADGKVNAVDLSLIKYELLH
jgi:hypothetical protein